VQRFFLTSVSALAALTLCIATAPAATPDARIVAEEYGKLPLSFEPVSGGTAPVFIARTAGGTVRLGETLELRLQPRPQQTAAPEAPSILRIAPQGARRGVRPRAMGELNGKSNFFLGDDPRHWRTDVPNFSRVEYSEIYRGIDLVYYGDRSGHLEHDFIVKRGANPAVIRLRLGDIESLQRLPTGDLELVLPHRPGRLGETATLRRPVIYQDIDGTRVAVSGGYAIQGPHSIGPRPAARSRSVSSLPSIKPTAPI